MVWRILPLWPGAVTAIYRNLLQNPKFAKRYVRRAKEVLAADGLLGEKSVVQVWDSLYYTIDKALYDEASRWGDYRRDVHPWQSQGKLYTVDKYYMRERNRLLTEYFPVRSRNVLNAIVDYVGIDDDWSPEELAGVENVVAQKPWDGRCYKLNGQVVTNPGKGIFVKNGKRIIIK